MRGACNDVGEIPAKGYGLIWGDFVEGSGGLLGLSDGESACWSCLWDEGQAEARRRRGR